MKITQVILIIALSSLVGCVSPRLVYVPDDAVMLRMGVRAEEPSATLSEQVPNVVKRLSSKNVTERVAVLDDVVAAETGDTLAFRLQHDLPEEDYRYILASILSGDLHTLPRERRGLCWMKICYLFTSLNMRDMTDELSAHLGTEGAGQFLILRTLAELNAAEAVPQIVPLLDSPIEHVQREALKALVELRAEEATPYLVEKLRNENHLQRYYALMDLVKVNARNAAKPIARLLEDPHENNRYWALDALVKLEAKEHAPQIWLLLDGSEPSNTEAYAVAALIAFGKRKALPLAVKKATVKDVSLRGRMLELLIQTKAKAVSSSFVEVLKDDRLLVRAGTDSNIRRDLMVCLGKLDAQEAIPVLRTYVKKPKNDFLQYAAVNALGVLRAKECVSDLLPLLLAEDGVTYRSSNVAIALARTGDKKVWSKLVQFVETPTHGKGRSDVICELNAFLDAGLWKTIHAEEVQGLCIKPVDVTVKAFTRETEVDIVLHAPKHQGKSQTAPASQTWPSANTSVNRIKLRYGIDEILDAFGDRNYMGTKDPFCFVFDDGRVHIMPVSQATAWWRHNVIPGIVKAD